MASNRIGTQIEMLIKREDWKQALRVIEQCLEKEPDDHWLWSRLSGVKYEQRDYQGALQAAEKALEVIDDCPLAIWSRATALEMLGKVRRAMGWYATLFNRGLEQLKNPDEDANECWEGRDWTESLMADCLFRTAGCLARLGPAHDAVEMYQEFLRVLDMGVSSTYSREDALNKINKLVPSKKVQREAALSRAGELVPAR